MVPGWTCPRSSATLKDYFGLPAFRKNGMGFKEFNGKKGDLFRLLYPGWICSKSGQVVCVYRRVLRLIMKNLQGCGPEGLSIFYLKYVLS